MRSDPELTSTNWNSVDETIDGLWGSPIHASRSHRGRIFQNRMSPISGARMRGGPWPHARVTRHVLALWTRFGSRATIETERGLGRSRGAGAFYRCFHFDRFNVPPPARATSQNRHEEATFLKDLSVSGGCDTLDLVLAASNNVCAERTRLSKYRINNKK